MTTALSPNKPDWIPVKHAADICGVSKRFLYERRLHGGGPPFHRRGKKILYRIPELMDWIELQRVEIQEPAKA